MMGWGVSHFTVNPRQGPEMEAVVLHRVRF